MLILVHKCLIILLLIFSNSLLEGQNYIGMHKNDIIQQMKSQSNYQLNKSAVNPYYKYLKYENKIDEITILYFLSDNNLCTMIRKMCDYSNINDELDELNRMYRAMGKDKWIYKDKGEEFIIQLEEGEWYFTLTTTKKRKN